MSYQTNSENKCSLCGHQLDLATGVSHGDAPVPGALSVCIRCAHIAIFADDLTLRELTAEEIAEIPADIAEELRRTQAAIRHLQSTKN